MMKKRRLFLYLVSIAMTFNQIIVGFSNAQEKCPNIILILVDDLGYKDAGFMGGVHYDTPYLDEMAKKSHVYYQAYAAASNCAPSRASLLTGLHTPRHGIYTVGSSARGHATDRKIIPVENKQNLDDHFLTLPELLKEEGYATASIGKWHIGQDPRSQGFDYNFGGNHKGHNLHFSPYQNNAIPDRSDGEYLTDRLTDEALRYLDNRPSGQPFFLYWSFFAVHTPIQAPGSLVEKYNDKEGTGRKAYATYAAMIASLDENIGRLVRYLDREKIADNTLIIFCSDNGGISAISPQTPLRGGKGTYFEGGIRIPFMVYWPEKIAAYSDSASVISHLDVFPTIKEMIGNKRTNTLDGVSLWSNLVHKQPVGSSLFWHFPVYLEAYDPVFDQAVDPRFRTRPGSVIREGKWKLHYYYENQDVLLFDLERDVAEQHNLSAQYPQKADELKGKLSDWLSQMKAPIPKEHNPEYIKPRDEESKEMKVTTKIK